jgi:hypothetical protein
VLEGKNFIFQFLKVKKKREIFSGNDFGGIWARRKLCEA